jgi:O-acetyl-ADP-ribose deacetylase (regulator of RNase III)
VNVPASGGAVKRERAFVANQVERFNVTYVGGRVDIVQGDITRLAVDAIVNAANSSLLGGGGVDGAIHRTAGPELKAECRTLGGATVGDAKITKGYRLPARYVIHAVGPVWRGGDQGEPELLAACYRNSLSLAVVWRLKTIAFPAISTGAYGYPVDAATRVALREVSAFLAADEWLGQVVLCCFSSADFDVYRRAADELLQ